MLVVEVAHQKRDDCVHDASTGWVLRWVLRFEIPNDAVKNQAEKER
jgi:hypothetical protein